jgi:predicted AAA+ superfamily ATPase
MEFDSIFFHLYLYICSMINRIASGKITKLAKKFKAIAVTGPRQSGKTTLVKELFKHKPYVSLENPDTWRFAIEDPRGFLSQYSKGAIFDEVQRTPEIFSYLQEILDTHKAPGQFILTGSNNFLLQQNIAQSLAGRVAFLNLLPFSIAELYSKGQSMPDEGSIMLNGLYPPIYDQHIPPQDWYPNYIRTYVDRDVRQIKNITDLIIFERFMRLLAGRTGQELNLTSLGVEAGVDTKTIQSWVGILESSFIIYLLKPHYRNFNKTIVKRPKIYFYDTGLVCSLLGITTELQLTNHPLRGSLFECLVVTELVKKRTNAGEAVNLFYWRDKTGHEIDVIIDEGDKLIPIEIKAGKTINTDFFKNILYWNSLSGMAKGYLIYTGDEEQKRSNGVEVINLQGLCRRGL